MPMNQPGEQFADESRAAAADWQLPPVAGLTQLQPQSSPSAPQQAQRVRYGFRIGDLGLLIDPDVGSEVVSVTSFTALPDAPRGFLGLINLRGNLVPLYELRDLLAMESRQKGNALIALVFGQGEYAVGVVVDSHPRALNSLQQLSELPLLPEALQAHVSAAYGQGEAVWLEFEHISFFDEVCSLV
jgi:twitching motility protein PilI